jgi:hypothetical protein
MKPVLGIAAGLLALALAGCSDNPVQPKFAAPTAGPAQSFSVSGPAVTKCQAAVDPDWLCQSQTIKDNLCPLLQTGGTTDIRFVFRFFTITYRVTFAPTSDGGASITVAFVTAQGTLVPLGEGTTVPAAKIAGFCPAAVG